MNKPNKSQQKHPRDAEGRYESKEMSGKAHGGQGHAQSARPRDAEGRFESKDNKKKSW
jgi:hypothetical protein